MQTKNQNTNIPKAYVIFSRKLAGYLLQNNLKLIKVSPSIHDPLKDVYLFEDTPLLRQIKEAYEIQKQQTK